MFVHYRTSGIVLKKENRGEDSQVITIFTKDFGKLKILGKAIRKIKSKLRASIPLFSLSEIEFIQGKAYKTLTDAILTENFKNTDKNLEKLKIAYNVSDITDNLIKGEERDRDVWILLYKTFHYLNNSLSENSYSLVYYYFLWNFFSILGYKPELKKCAICQNNLNPINFYFSPEQGGTICNKCFKKTKERKKVHSETIKILRVILEKDWKFLARLKIEPEHKKNLNLISKYYLSYLYNILEIS